MNLLKDLNFDVESKNPIYQEIANCIVQNIANGNIKKDTRLPSINVFSKEYKVSRDTVEKAYKNLKAKKIAVGIKGLGTFINSTKLVSKNRVLFLINKLSSYKLKIYHSFINTIGKDYHTDVEIYHCDESLFLSLLENNLNRYDYYIIMPHFNSVGRKDAIVKKESLKLIESIPRKKLIILDNNDMNIDGNIIEIFQDFDNDIYNSLLDGLKKIKKYQSINLILSKRESYPYLRKICNGFIKFCNEFSFDFRILNSIGNDEIIDPGNLFVVISDEDLVNLLDSISINKELILGENVGVISYNETPFKRLLNIAVISTDFIRMGETAANMITKNKKGRIKNPFVFIDRSSI